MGWISDRHMKSGGSLNHNPANNGSQRGPLRRVVGYTLNPYLPEGGPETFWELLECGHSQPVKRDLFGETNASRRRCARCRREAEESPTIPAGTEEAT